MAHGAKLQLKGCYLSLSYSLALYWQGSGVEVFLLNSVGGVRGVESEDVREPRASQGHPKAHAIPSMPGERLTTSSFFPLTSLIYFPNFHAHIHCTLVVFPAPAHPPTLLFHISYFSIAVTIHHD